MTEQLTNQLPATQSNRCGLAPKRRVKMTKGMPKPASFGGEPGMLDKKGGLGHRRAESREMLCFNGKA